MQLGALRRPPAAFAGHNLVALGLTAHRTDQDGLQQALGRDGVRELGEIAFGEHLARLIGIGLDQFDGQGLDPIPVAGRTLGVAGVRADRFSLFALAQQGGQAPAQAAARFAFVCTHAGSARQLRAAPV